MNLNRRISEYIFDSHDSHTEIAMKLWENFSTSEPFFNFTHSEIDLINSDLYNKSMYSYNTCTAIINSMPLSILSFTEKEYFQMLVTHLWNPSRRRGEITRFKAERKLFYPKHAAVYQITVHLSDFIFKSKF